MFASTGRMRVEEGSPEMMIGPILYRPHALGLCGHFNPTSLLRQAGSSGLLADAQQKLTEPWCWNVRCGKVMLAFFTCSFLLLLVTKGIATSNKCLTSSNKKLVETIYELVTRSFLLLLVRHLLLEAMHLFLVASCF